MEAVLNRVDMPLDVYVTYTVIISITFFWGFPSGNEKKNDEEATDSN